jgi:DNA-binding MarR family transcriptional regulator
MRKGFLTMSNFNKYRMCGELNTTISGKMLYLMLTDIVDGENKIIIPLKCISEALGITRGTVSRNMHRLERIGKVRIVPTFNEYGGQMPNKYYVED